MFADTFPNANARVADILKRKRRTPTQTTLDKEEREANIKNAFEIRGEKYIRGHSERREHSNCRRCHDKRRDAFRMRKNIEARGIQERVRACVCAAFVVRREQSSSPTHRGCEQSAKKRRHIRRKPQNIKAIPRDSGRATMRFRRANRRKPNQDTFGFTLPRPRFKIPFEKQVFNVPHGTMH